jgi:hypothetical protein
LFQEPKPPLECGGVRGGQSGVVTIHSDAKIMEDQHCLAVTELSLQKVRRLALARDALVNVVNLLLD